MAVQNAKIISTVGELESSFNIAQVSERVEPKAVLMCEPTHFDVKDCKNPFMEGQINNVDTDLAKRQWRDLKATIEKLGYAVHVVPAVADLEDMVFAANQVLVGVSSAGKRYAVSASMVHPSRRREVPFYADWFKSKGYEVYPSTLSPDGTPCFEGQGDAIWHPGKQLLWGAYGFRSQRAAYERIAELIDARVFLLELVRDKFYHLDTAFCALDESTVMIYPPAFAPQSLELIRRVFTTVIELSDADAENFAGNGLALGRSVVLQKGSRAACSALRAAGFEPVEVETGEFMKSGGSVFCLKMMVFD
jgi:N-dimethylarginine dimethylaminohydrolase